MKLSTILHRTANVFTSPIVFPRKNYKYHKYVWSTSLPLETLCLAELGSYLGQVSNGVTPIKTIFTFPGRIIINSQFARLSTVLNMKVSICLETWLLLAIAIHEWAPFCMFPEAKMDAEKLYKTRCSFTSDYDQVNTSVVYGYVSCTRKY